MLIGMVNTLHDKEIPCPVCNHSYLHEGIPTVLFEGEGYGYKCKQCGTHYRVGMVIRPTISLYRRG
jgi:transcription elongation factor Elf1